MAGWQDDPVVGAAPTASSGGGGWQNDPIVGATSDNDYSKSPLSAVARTFESSADWGTGDLLRAAATGKKPSETAAQSSAAAASLPWYVRYPTEAAGYGLGLVNLLDPVTDAAEAGALGLGAGAKLAKIAGTAAEGATVGAVSHVAGSDDPGLTDTAGAALGGGLVGTAAGAATPLINKGLSKVLTKPGTVDPIAAQAQTKAASDAAYAALHQKPADPQAITGALKGVLTNLDPSVMTGMSPGLKSTIVNIGQTVQNLPEANMGQLNSWSRQIDAAAQRERYPTDQVVAGKITSAFDDLMQQGGAGDLNEAAQAAAQKNIMAEKLGDWQAKAGVGGTVGQAPFSEAQNWYDPGSDQYKTLVDLYQKPQNPGKMSWAMGHLGANALGALGGSIAGYPGAFAGEALAGYLALKPAIAKLMKGYDKNQLLKAYQAAYPSLTGIQPTGAKAAPQISDQVGEQIKNLLMGATVS